MSGADATLAALRRGDLAGARDLRLVGLGLTEFPQEILGLAETLEVLDLGHNRLTTLPDDLPRLRNLHVLFASDNPFDHLPPVLGDCADLSQIGFRGCGTREIPAEALPPRLRWLTLTDNALETLPEALGERPALLKLMLSGNRLSALPVSLEGAERLELLRIAANRFEALPDWVERLPSLAWLACAGNPVTAQPAAPVAAIPWSDLVLGDLLGEGASGRVHAAQWRGAATRAVAVKLFRGAMTSDGLPDSEMAACLAAGDHPNLAGAFGRIAGHPDGMSGLVMPLMQARWRVLAGPPSLESCSRDVYAAGCAFAPEVVLRLAAEIGRGAARLHALGLLHGDLYAHNVLWDGAEGSAVLSDFGAASTPPASRFGTLQRLDVRAWGILLGELMDRCTGDLPAALHAVQAACVQPNVAARPTMAEAMDVLERMAGYQRATF